MVGGVVRGGGEDDQSSPGGADEQDSYLESESENNR